MKLLLCELDALLVADSPGALASLFPNGQALVDRLRAVAAMEPSSSEGSEASLYRLLLPFLALHQIGDEDLAAIGRSVPILVGAHEMLTSLKELGWMIRLWSSAYEPYPAAVAARLRLAPQEVIATPYPEEALSAELGAYALASISELAEDLGAILVSETTALAERVARFYRNDISYSGFAEILEAAAPLASQEIVVFAKNTLNDFGLSWPDTAALALNSSAVFVSNTVQEGGGLAISFNQAVQAPGVLTFAKNDLNGLLEVLKMWERKGLEVPGANAAGDLHTMP
jgi:predicted HAD superfamily phosphohydrolase